MMQLVFANRWGNAMLRDQFVAVTLLFAISMPATAQLTGTYGNWDASTPGATPATSWDDTAGPAFDWNLVNSPTLNNAIMSQTNITSAYEFNGSNTRGNSGANYAGTQSDHTFEFWFRPTDLVGNELVWEIGGTGDGSSLRLEGSNLLFRSKDDGDIVETSADLTDIFTGDFIQAAVEVDMNLNEARLYVNGQFESSDSDAGWGDFAGGDPNNVGGPSGQIGGQPPGGPGFFEGDIAIIRGFDSLLGPDDILANYNALAPAAAVPEPSSVLIWSLVAMGLVAGYRRRRGRK